MHRQLTATGVLTLCLVMGAGILLTAQLHMAGGNEWSGIPIWALGVGEALIYLSALLLWAPGLSSVYLILGVGGMLVFRLAIGTGAALVHSLIRNEAGFSESLVQCLSNTLPVACSIVFAVLAFYPLKTLFSHATRSARLRQQAAHKRAAQQLSSATANRTGTFLFGAPEAKAAHKTNDAGAASPKPRDQRPSAELPEHLKNCELTVPLRVIFPQMPAGVLRAKLAEQVLDDGMEIKIPLKVVAPQLKEALIQIAVTEILSYLPKSWVENGSVETEEQITLPLEVIVPQLPEEVLQLPPASPPAWAAESTQEEEVLFARV